MYAIVAKDLIKKFDSVEAVKGLSFEIEEGELFGLLGPNGAGKTTTISMLSTMLKPTSGSATVWGYDVVREPDNVRRAIGVVFQDQSLDLELSGRQNLEFHAKLYKVRKDKRSDKIDELIGLVDLKDQLDKAVETYSGGMKRRLEIARGLIHEPNILFLDEPTLGLDPQTRRFIWQYIKRLNDEKNVTIILTTHYMEEADHLCDRIAIIDHGSFVAQGKPSELKRELGGDIVTIKVPPDNGEFIKKVEPLECVESVQSVDGNLHVTVDNGETAVPILMNVARLAGVEVPSISVQAPTLEDVFIKYTGREMRPEEVSEFDNIRAMMRGQ